MSEETLATEIVYLKAYTNLRNSVPAHKYTLNVQIEAKIIATGRVITKVCCLFSDAKD